jgi:hypothetical protein
MATASSFGREHRAWHTRATWSAREDRLPSLVWLAFIWFGMIAGFGTDLRRFLHENPSPSWVVHIHAFVFTIWLLLLTAQVLLVAGDRVALHRRLGWFAASWVCLMAVLGTWAAMVAKAPVVSGPASPQFLSLQMGALIAFVALTGWGIVLRKNPAAHKRIMILATVAILDPGYGRLAAWIWPQEPSSTLMWFFWDYGANVLLVGLMAAWDLRCGRLMKQFVIAAVGLLAVEYCEVLLYHWGPWKAFTTRLVASWATHFR